MKKRNIAPLLLCFGSVACTIGAVVTAIKTAPIAAELRDEVKREKGEDCKTLDIAKATWKIWTPTAGLIVLSAVCTFGSHRLNLKHQAAILSSAAIARQKFAQYQNKIREVCGEELHKKAVERIQTERCKPVPIESQGGFYSLRDEFQHCEDEPIRLIYDTWSDRYLETTFPKLLEAEIHFSRNFVFGAAQSLNDFYDFLGASHTEIGDVIGWVLDDEFFSIDFIHEPIEMNDGTVCYAIGSVFPPSNEFLQYR